MKSTDFIISNYLNAENATELNHKTLSIYEVKTEIISDVTKMVIGFEGVEKVLVVNKTNNLTMTEAYGEETDNWRDKKVRLDIVGVMFKGKRTPSIQITPIAAETAPEPAKKASKK